MIEPSSPGEPRGLPVSPQLAMRVAIMGGVALVLFAIIFFRLWYLQVLTGNQFRAQADVNRVRNVAIAAPRGEILDRNGLRLASDRTSNAVQIVPAELPAPGPARAALFRRLAHVLRMSARRIDALVTAGHNVLPYANVTVKLDTGYGVLAYLAEHNTLFPGVHNQQISIRAYPYNGLAAQLLGYVSQISGPELAYQQFRGVSQGTIVGQDGLESSYDRYLRGNPGVQRVQVNSQGQYRGTLTPTTPVSGHDVRLTLDLGLQREGDRALQQGMALANANGNPAGAGAFVAMDPRNGQVLAMGSSPTFDPNMFARPLTQAQYDSLKGTSTVAGPLFNRAVNGLYPTGSTFKPITALAGLQSGLISPGTAMGGGACVTISRQDFCNAGKTDYGALSLQSALRVSEDTYFYELGAMANGYGGVIQNMARKLGLGGPTSIDLPNEPSGVIPDRAWRARRNAIEFACRARRHVASCGITDGNPWTIGDNVQLATGQGDLLASPLQMATTYSTLANTFANGSGHGIVPVPHVAQEVDDATGRLVQLINPPPPRTVTLDPAALDVVMAGLHDAASAPGGTSADVWNGFPRMVYGKTGTAQHGGGQSDQSWYVCYLPDKARPIVIAVTIEKGGFGDQAAAPAARLMASQWFHQPLKVVAGASRSR